MSSNHTVLTIEDQADIRRLIRMTLEFKGFTVLEAGDAAEGLKLARQHQPAMILLDVMMPGEDGLSLSRTLSQDARLRHTPVVMLSALGNAEDVENGLAAGARAYLVKPFDPWELLALVNRLLAEPAAAANGA